MGSKKEKGKKKLGQGIYTKDLYVYIINQYIGSIKRVVERCLVTDKSWNVLFFTELSICAKDTTSLDYLVMSRVVYKDRIYLVIAYIAGPIACLTV